MKWCGPWNLPAPQPFAAPGSGSGALVERDVLALGRARVDLARTPDLGLLLVRFLPMRQPAREPADREEHGEHGGWEAHGPVAETRIEIDLGVELPLDEILVGE